MAIQRLHSLCRFVIIHNDEAKTAKAIGVPVLNHVQLFNFAKSLEQFPHFCFCRGERQVSHIDLFCQLNKLLIGMVDRLLAVAIE